MAIAQKPLNNTGPLPTTDHAAYILEELLLPGKKSDFVKYLHNASATSELSLDDPDYQHAKFLMFIQHVQYAITGGVAYVSDFQGMMEPFFLLLDHSYLYFQELGPVLLTLKFWPHHMSAIQVSIHTPINLTYIY